MNKFIFLGCAILLAVSCADKMNGANKISLIEEDAQQIKNEPVPYFMYVNSNEGLRVRDKPALSGNILDVIQYKKAVMIFDKSENVDFIDGMTEFWYQTKIDDAKGWVFGGYLKGTIAEIAHEEIIGLFFADEIEVKLEDGFHRGKYFSLLDNGLFDLSDINFEISRIRDKEFLIKYQFPFYGSPNTGFNNAKFRFPDNENNPFCQLSGESGSGGIYLDFYLNEGNIILDLSEERGYGCDEENDNSIQRFRSLITFKKAQ